MCSPRLARWHPADYALIWVKWRLLHAALQHAQQVLFLDADVLLLRNPFSTLLRQNDTTAAYGFTLYYLR